LYIYAYCAFYVIRNIADIIKVWWWVKF